MKNQLKFWYRMLSSRWQTLHLDYPVEFKPRSSPDTDLGNPMIQGIIANEQEAISSFSSKILEFKGELQQIKTRANETNPLLPGWNNGFLPGLDMAALFTVIAHHRPRKYIEVGSGNSTLVAAAAKSQFSPDTEIISIDPFPRADIDQISQRIIRTPFEKLGDELLEELAPGDVLFIDNSHRILPNSDGTVFFLEWLPQLQPGVLVQIHDIYLPWDYPESMCERGYSEQYMLAMALLSNPMRFRPFFPAFWVHQQEELRNELAPIWDHPNTKSVEQHGGSFWFEIGE